MSETAWEELKLSEIFRLNTESVTPATTPKELFHHHSIPAFDQFGSCIVEPGGTIESNKTKISCPSVLVSKLNPRKPRVSLVKPSEGEQHCSSTEFICYQPIDSNEELRFWRLFFHSNRFSRRLEQVAVGSTNSHTRANPRETLTWKVPNPSREEKSTIANILDTLDTQIRQTEAIIAKLHQVKQGLLHDLLTRGIDANGQLRPPRDQAPELYKESPLGWIPREWDVLRLSDVATKVSDGVHYAVERSDEGVPFLFVSCIRDGYIDWSKAAFTTEKTFIEISKRSRPHRGMVLFTVVGSYGHAAYIDRDMDFGFERNIAYISSDERQIDSEYLFHWMSSDFVMRQTEKVVIGNAQKVLTLSELKGLYLKRPSQIEQNLICTFVDQQSKRIDDERSLLDKLKKQKSGLMDNLLTGRVRVTSLLDTAKAS